MPVKIPSTLPAAKILTEENIFVMDEERAVAQDIRPLHIGIVNLMPTKEVTETQLLRLLGNTPLQIEVTLITMASHESANTNKKYLQAFYRTFAEVKDEKFDGLIITGAPVENLAFEDVDYWRELEEIMAWSSKHVYSTLYICWAALAGLYFHYGIGKYALDKKVFGVYPHRVLDPRHPLLRGFDDVFYAPHSRHSTVAAKDILAAPDLILLAESDEAGVCLAASQNGRQVYVLGHVEYDYNTLDLEYKRDLGKGLAIEVPKNYYPCNNPDEKPEVYWRSHANLLYANWLNYFVYQVTPYDIHAIE